MIKECEKNHNTFSVDHSSFSKNVVSCYCFGVPQNSALRPLLFNLYKIELHPTSTFQHCPFKSEIFYNKNDARNAQIEQNKSFFF